MTEVMLFEKKPIQVEAVWYMNETIASDVLNWIHAGDGTATFHHEIPQVLNSNGEIRQHAEASCVRIHTLEGVMRAESGDWIIKGVQGEFYPCKPDIFEATYTQVTFPADMPDEVI